jgi:PIN domain nuclease of toxin-antitoxin system
LNQLLLDTCAAIWIGNSEELSDEAVAALDEASDQGEPVYISPISAWEIGMLACRGRFASPLSPQAWFDRFLAIGRFQLTELVPSLLIGSSFLPGNPPKDPMDRIIIVTAREEGLRLITRDRVILDYGRAGHVNVLAC